MLEGLKEIERLRRALGHLLWLAESGRYGPAGFRAAVRQTCADALGVQAEDDAAAAAGAPALPAPTHAPQRLLEAPKPQLEAPPTAAELDPVLAHLNRRARLVIWASYAVTALSGLLLAA